MGNNLADLTILLRMIDQTKKGFKTHQANITKSESLTRKLSVSWKLMGGVVGGALVLLKGVTSQLTDKQQQLSNKLGESLGEVQALYGAIREGDPTATIDNISEAMLTLQERISDAAISGGGPLAGLIQDLDGFDDVFREEGARGALALFLEETAKLPLARDRIFALKEVMSDLDSEAFLNIIQDGDKLNELLISLRTNVEDIPGIFSEREQQNVKQYAKSVGGLRGAWEDLGQSIDILIKPALGVIFDFLANIVRAADWAVKGVRSLFDLALGSDVDVLEKVIPTTTAATEAQMELVKKEITEQKAALESFTGLIDGLDAQIAGRKIVGIAEGFKPFQQTRDDINLTEDRIEKLDARLLLLAQNLETVSQNSKEFGFESGLTDVAKEKLTTSSKDKKDEKNTPAGIDELALAAGSLDAIVDAQGEAYKIKKALDEEGSISAEMSFQRQKNAYLGIGESLAEMSKNFEGAGSDEFLLAAEAGITRLVEATEAKNNADLTSADNLEELVQRQKEAYLGLADIIGETAFYFNGEDEDSTAYFESIKESLLSVSEAHQSALDIQQDIDEKAASSAEKTFQRQQKAYLGVGNLFGQMATLAAGKSEKAFKFFKAVQIGLSTVAAYSAATQSLAEAKGDPFLRIAAYAEILGVGLSAVAAIQQTNIGSSGGDSAGGNTSTANTGGTPGTGIGSSPAEQEASELQATKQVNITVPPTNFAEIAANPEVLEAFAEGFRALGAEVNLQQGL